VTIRIISEGWRHQYHRMKRSRDRFNAPHQIADEYDVASFSSQEVSVRSSSGEWHLKDWFANDASLVGHAANVSKDTCRQSGQLPSSSHILSGVFPAGDGDNQGSLSHEDTGGRLARFCSNLGQFC